VQLPRHIARFFQAYQLPIISVTLILVVIVALRVVLAVIDTLIGVPLLTPTFELIGISYLTWLIFRYLLKAANRRELADKIQDFKEQILGKNPSETMS
jgi:threonine/homoserine/homoserine lactone efflux protein